MNEVMQAYTVMGVLGFVVVFLLWDKLRPSIVFLVGVLILLVIGIIPVEDLLSGFSNKSIITIFLLILASFLLSKTYNLVGFLDKIFGTTSRPKGLIWRMATSVGSFSAVMNNTPIVALMIPYIYQWSQNNNVAPSKLFIPLSFAAIVGGMMTPIGTSTNLVLIGFMVSAGHPTLTFIDFLIPGIIIFVISILFLTFLSQQLLPVHLNPIEEFKQNIRQYLTEMEILENSELIGKNISEANLRNLKGIFLAEIHRGENRFIRPVAPEVRLKAGDRLFFAGETSEVINLVEEIDGLTWAKEKEFQLPESSDIIEVVIPFNSTLEGKTLKQVQFRETYDAAVIGVHRKGERLRGKLGEIPLVSGDLLLLLTGNDFKKLSSKNLDFYTVSVIEKEEESPLWKKWTLGLLTLASIAAIVFQLLSLFVGVLLILGGGILLNLISEEEAKKNVSLELFIILGSAITLGMAFINTGAAEMVAEPFMEYLIGLHPIWILTGVFGLTLIFTSFITNAAAISIMFPLVYQLIVDLQLNPTPIYLTLAFAASAAFLTPVSYQTNLMVMGPGSYKTRDFLKIGIPFTFVYGILLISFIMTFYTINE